MLTALVAEPSHAIHCSSDKPKLTQSTAGYLTSEGRYELSQMVSSMALNLCKAGYGEMHVQTFISMWCAVANLTMMGCWNKPCWTEAAELLSEIIVGLEAIVGKQDYLTITARMSLAGVYALLQRFGDAKEILEPLVEDCQGVLDTVEGPRALSNVEHQLARTYLLEKINTAAAVQMLQNVVADCERRDGRLGSFTQSAKVDLASAYFLTDQSEKAEVVIREVLEQARSAADLQMEIASLEFLLAKVCVDLGRCKEALEILENLAAYIERVYGKESAQYVKLMEVTRVSLGKEERKEDELKVAEQIMAIQEQRLGSQDAGTLMAIATVADRYRTAQRYDDALKAWNRVVPSINTVLGDDHPDTLRCNFGLAITHLKMKNYMDAFMLGQEVVHLREQVLGVNHKDTIDVRNFLKPFTPIYD